MLIELTPEQKALLPIIRNKWVNRFNSLEFNEEKAKIFIEGVYTFSKLNKPDVLFVDSPLGCQMAYNILLKLAKKKTNSVENSVWNSVGNSVKNSVRDSVENSVGNNVGNSVKNSVWNSVGNSVKNSVRDSVENSDIVYCITSAYIDLISSGWVSFYDYFTEIGILKHNDFNTYNKLFFEASIFYSLTQEGIAIVSRPPIFMNRDIQERLHCTHDYAIAFRDGFKIAFIHGVEIPYEIFEKFRTKILTFKEIMQIENTDVRFAILSEFDKEKLLEEAQAELISNEETTFNRSYKLYVLPNLIDGKIVKMLVYADLSNGKIRFKFVPENHTSALTAIAESHHMTVEEYAEVECHT